MRAIPILRYLPLILPAIRLAWALMWDRRVGAPIKLLPILAAVYVISPLDVLPDIIPVVGWVDDLIVAGGLIMLFFVLAPYGVVLEHLRGTGTTEETGRSIADPIDATYRFTDEDRPL
ncbi:MAG: DUF1232 domain-containing protein [Chloroflexi bacterium]|nr:DUF1232 domain-containing protein [Chloroflexota bacterium]